MARRLGRSGELLFAQLAADYGDGATCNPSLEDDKGWDHVIEFDVRPVAGLSADLQVRLPPISIQVKTHADPANLSARISLTNSLSFTRTPNPCFLIIITAPPGGKPTYYLRHWWEDEIGRTLERARKLSSEGMDERAMGARTLSISMSPDEGVEGKALIEALRATVESIGRDYAAAKRSIIETVGFGTDRLQGRLTIGPVGSVDDLLDHQLGLTTSISVTQLTLSDRRFGIDVPFPMPSGEITHASIQANPSSTCRIRLKGPDAHIVTVPGDVLVASIPVEGNEATRVRFRTEVLDIIWDLEGKLTFRGRIDGSRLLDLRELGAGACLLSWGGRGDIDVTVHIDGEKALGALGRLDAGGDEHAFEAFALEIDTLVALAELADVRPQLSLYHVASSGSLGPMHAALSTDGLNMNAETVGPIVDPIRRVLFYT